MTNIMIKENLDYILANYLLEKQNNLGGNLLASFIRKEVSTSLKSKLPLDFDFKYKTYGGCGQLGNWAAVPWVLISDREITTSAQYGYYLVFLFQENMDGVYISLNQGYKQYLDKFGRKSALQEIVSITKKLRNLARQSLNQFALEIDLNASNDYSTGYELGHVCGRFYKKGAIPNDDLIIEDIFQLLGVYKLIKDIVGNDILLIKNRVDDYYDIDDEPSANERLSISERLSDFQTDDEIQSELEIFENEFQNKKPGEIKIFARTIERNPKIADLIKRKYNFVCQICGYPGFEKKDGNLFAEAHHLESLGNSGLDIPSNIFCVCSTCHSVITLWKRSSVI